MTRIAIGTDHAGYRLKEVLESYLLSKGYEVEDFGTDSEESVDYPDFIRPVALSVAEGKNDFGIVVGGSGNGEAMVANKVRGIRCAVCWTVESAQLAKEHNNANVISMGARLVSEETAKAIVDAWLGAEFQAGRHVRRLEKMAQQEEEERWRSTSN